MKLTEKLKKIYTNKKEICISGKMTQYGRTPAIMNADLDGSQKTTENLKGETVPTISQECQGNGYWPRMGMFSSLGKKPKNKSYSVETLATWFKEIKKDNTPYRGGTKMEKDVMNLGQSKAFVVDVAYPFNNNKDYKVNVNHRLGIQADSGINDFPREMVGYTNLCFASNIVFDLECFVNENGLIREFVENVDELGDTKEEKDFKKEVESWIDLVYPTKEDGELDVEKIVEKLRSVIEDYKHPVQRKYCPDLQVEILDIFLANSRKEGVEYRKAWLVHLGK